MVEYILQTLDILVISITAIILWNHRKILKQTLDFQKETLNQTNEFERQKKTVEATIECNKRFDAICNLENRKEDSESFFSRFWSLQKNQFDYFTKGFIDKHDFKYWMISRHVDMVTNASYGTKGKIRDGYNVIRDKWQPHEFILFFETYVYREEDIEMEKNYLKGNEIPTEIISRITDGIEKQLK